MTNSTFYTQIQMHLYKGILLTLGYIILNISQTQGYTFGMLSHNKDADSIQHIEINHGIKVPMVSFIWDQYNSSAIHTVTNLSNTLGTDRIYHITLSPDHYTARQVYQGHFDWQYDLLFKHIKEHNLKVVFRTMHEMNGGRYPWAGDPIMFRKAWIRIHNLSRQAGLDQSQILFDFSTNGWDMPTVGGATPHQQAQLTTCNLKARKQTGCFSWEDYYPGSKYVDLIGVTFYNWGKATSNRQRLTPQQIMEEPQFDIFTRLKAKNKPIIIDEVGTTSIWYEGTYNRNLSLQMYASKSGANLKNQWIKQLTDRASSKPEIIALSYFNVDRTMGLAWENPGEADRSAIDLEQDRYYSSIMNLYQGGDQGLHKLFISSGAKVDIISKPIATTGSISHTGSTNSESQANKQWWKK